MAVRGRRGGRTSVLVASASRSAYVWSPVHSTASSPGRPLMLTLRRTREGGEPGGRRAAGGAAPRATLQVKQR